jgi:endonuclease/exonuclease/phosphatase family metal-dependent hydrolase
MESEPKNNSLIRIATYNIRSGRNSRLEMALRAMRQMNVDLGVLTKARLTGIHTLAAEGYQVRATVATSHYQGGVALFWRDDANVFQVESEQSHGPNVMSFELVTGRRRFLVIGCYIPPSEIDGTTCSHITTARRRKPRLPLIVLGDLNVNFYNLKPND